MPAHQHRQRLQKPLLKGGTSQASQHRYCTPEPKPPVLRTLPASTNFPQAPAWTLMPQIQTPALCTNPTLRSHRLFQNPALEAPRHLEPTAFLRFEFSTPAAVHAFAYSNSLTADPVRCVLNQGILLHPHSLNSRTTSGHLVPSIAFAKAKSTVDHEHCSFVHAPVGEWHERL